MRWAGHIACIRETRNAYKVLVGKSEGKRPFVILRHRWEDNIKMDVKEMGWEVMDCIHLAQDRDWWHALVKISQTVFPSNSF
jgi:hypothetical protein